SDNREKQGARFQGNRESSEAGTDQNPFVHDRPRESRGPVNQQVGLKQMRGGFAEALCIILLRDGCH
ncbi:MAG TPA: hypothetical protein VKD23_10965, partial [Terriglobales bacterium]|nr:hypothetical protein [Terriglobales bacterium]